MTGTRLAKRHGWLVPGRSYRYRLLCWLAYGMLVPLVAVRAQSPNSAPRSEQPLATAKLALFAPLDYQVIQRRNRAGGTLTIAGTVAFANKILPPNASLEARLGGTTPDGPTPAAWQALPFDPRVPAFQASLNAPAGGWYRLELRLVVEGKTIAETAVEHLGMGEVFVIAGQSNSANHGEGRQKTLTGLVTSFDGTRWRVADDPQGGASGNGGSFMPAFGDALHKKYGVPIGVAAVGVGATSVRQWLMKGEPVSNLPTLTPHIVTVGPGKWECDGGLFDNLVLRLQSFGPHGCRAVLWHQGESDANQQLADRTLSGNRYRDDLAKIIRASQSRAGWPVPWFVAQASYHTPDDPGSPEIRAAQKALWTRGVALPGPDTDALTGPMRDHGGKGVHFSAAGLQAHGHLWAEKVGDYLDKVLKP